MRKEYNKLVRDRIPEIIRRDGRIARVVVLAEDAYRDALRAKVIEEAEEVAAAGEAELVKEIGDLYEVLDALIAAYGLDERIIRSEQERRRDERGGFERRLQARPGRLNHTPHGHS